VEKDKHQEKMDDAGAIFYTSVIANKNNQLTKNESK
jgi:hypothetical protein